MLDFSEHKQLLSAQDKLKKQRGKSFKLDKKSLSKAQAHLDKLRPIRDAIEKQVRSVSGFSGIIIRSDSVLVLVCDKLSKAQVEEMTKKYKKVIVELVTRKTRKRNAPIA
jgi:hypothetical protein